MLRKQLIRDEGDIPHAYQDSLGYWTVGVGFLIDKRRGGGVPQEVRDFWLDCLINKIRTELTRRLPVFREIDSVRQDALVNMAYQLGINGLLRFEQTLALISMHRFDEAANEALNSNWAKQTPDRARRIARQIASGQYQ